jgi:uncharacterized protein
MSKASTKKALAPKTDWEAVERDYRTGRFTLRELEAKHGASYAQISRKAKALNWQKDLREVIKQATNAAVLHDSATKAQKSATEIILVAAELNKQVILGHRDDIKSTRSVAVSLLNELSNAALLAEHAELLTIVLAGEGAEPADVSKARQAVQRALSINSRITSIKALAETFSKLQSSERVAFGISDEEGSSKERGPGELLADFAASLHARKAGRLPIAPTKAKEGDA